MDNLSLITTPAQIWDSEEFFELSKQPDIQKEFPNMRFSCLEEAKEFLEYRIKDTKAKNPNFFKMIKLFFGQPFETHTNENSVLIGFIEIHNVGIMDRMLSGGLKESINFAIAPCYSGEGLMTLALTMSIEAMMDDGYTYISALVKAGNTASKRVLQKCGFIKIRELYGTSTFIRRIAMDKDEFSELKNKIQNI